MYSFFGVSMFLKYHGPVLAWGALILLLCLYPIDPCRNTQTTVPLLAYDVIGHLIFFAVFVALAARSLNRLSNLSLLNMFPLRFALVIGISYGTLIELLQYRFIPGRHLELPDLAANTLGALAGVILTRVLFGSRSCTGTVTNPDASHTQSTDHRE